MHNMKICANLRQFESLPQHKDLASEAHLEHDSEWESQLAQTIHNKKNINIVIKLWHSPTTPALIRDVLKVSDQAQPVTVEHLTDKSVEFDFIIIIIVVVVLVLLL